MTRPCDWVRPRSGELGCHFLSAGRRRARRSSSVVPPHTPEVIPWSIAQARHAACAGHARQIRLASSIWRCAGPIVPTGKKKSASRSRQAASSRQSVPTVIVRTSIRPGGLPSWFLGILSASRTPFRLIRQCQSQHGEGASSCSGDFADQLDEVAGRGGQVQGGHVEQVQPRGRLVYDARWRPSRKEHRTARSPACRRSELTCFPLKTLTVSSSN